MGRGISNLVTEIILIAITVALAMIVYAWITLLMTRLGSNLLPPLVRITSITLAYGNLRNSFDVPYNYGYFVIATIKVPVATRLTAVGVYADGRSVCYCDLFAESADDLALREPALVFAGYYGLEPRKLDDEDSVTPGLILLTTSNKQGNSTSNVGYLELENNYYTPISPGGEEAPSWASVYSGDYYNLMVSPYKVEKYLTHYDYRLKFEGLEKRLKAFYNSTSDQWVYVRGFNSVALSPGTYTLVIWCKDLRIASVNVIELKIFTDSYEVDKTFQLTDVLG